MYDWIRFTSLILLGLSSSRVCEASNRNTTCDALKNTASKVQAYSHLGVMETCNTTANCLGIECVSQGLASTYTSLTILPCTNPVAIRTRAVVGDQVVLDRIVNHSMTFDRDLPLVGALTFNWTYIPRNNSVTIGLELLVTGNRYTVVPITPIPIDDNLCPANNGTNTPPTGTTPTLPTPPPGSRTPNDMCEAVQLVATEVPSRVSLPPLTLEEGCSAFENCTGVSCMATYGNDQYNATLTILQCKKPTAVNIVLNDANGMVHINRTMDKNTTIPFSVYGFEINVFVTVLHPSRDSMLLAIVAKVSVIDIIVTILPATVIPLDRSMCISSPCDQWNLISDDVDKLVERHNIKELQSDSCNVFSNCSGVSCSIQYSTLGFSSTLQGMLEVLPCMDPPGMYLKVYDNNGNVIADHVFTRSEVLQNNVQFAGFQVPVTTNVSMTRVPGAVYFGLVLTVPLFGAFEIVPKTLIPVDKTSCSTDVPADSPGGTTDNLTQQAPTTQLGLTLGLVLGVSFLIILLGLVVFGVIFTVACWRRQRMVLGSGPVINFATKDYTDSDNIDDLDDFQEGYTK